MFGGPTLCQKRCLFHPVFTFRPSRKPDFTAEPLGFDRRPLRDLIEMVDAKIEKLLFNDISNAIDQRQVVGLPSASLFENHGLFSRFRRRLAGCRFDCRRRLADDLNPLRFRSR